MKIRDTMNTKQNIMIDKEDKKNRVMSTADQARRQQLLMLAGVAGGAVAMTTWGKPIVNAIVLPAHAQTSCTTDTVVGGPLAGNASGATTCQAACEAEAADQSAQLCRVEESLDALNAVQCSCDLDLPI